MYVQFADGGGSSDPVKNPLLRSAIDIAMKNYVPKATIQSALKTFNDTPNATALQRYYFECRLYGRIFIIMAYCTANVAKTKIPLNTALRKHNAEMIRTRHLFDERGIIDAIAPANIDNVNGFDDAITENAIECGADDVEIFDSAKRLVTFYCEPRTLVAVRGALEKHGYQIESSEWVFDTTNRIQLTAAEQADYAKFNQRLNEIEGFDCIYDNVMVDT